LALSQSINTEFGKNRVQFHNDFRSWWSYETENFITYWYGKGRNVAKTVVQMSELDHDEIQNIMEHRFNDKIEIIVYVDITDIKQSNIGLEETFRNNPKETKIEGNKMFVYFNGDHNHLRQQIKKGITAIYLNSILIGTNLQEMVQNAVLLHLPQWFKKGMVSYVASPWNIESDDELRDLMFVEDGKYYDFDKLSEDYPRIAGHSFWHFLDQKYGRSSISNILYLTRINRSIESSFVYVLSQDFEDIVVEWQEFYTQKFSQEENRFDSNNGSELDLQNKDHQVISLLRLSPDGTQLVYIYNDIGKYKVILRDLATGDEKKIFQHGFRNTFQETDYEYPQVEWHPNGLQLSIVYENRDQLMIRKYYLSDEEYEEQPFPKKIQRIYSFSYVDADEYILSANDNGFSDLFNFKFKTRQFKKITEDYHDDLDAVYTNVNGKNGILFSSNRESNLVSKEQLDSILPLDNYDLFFMPDGSKELQRITFTPLENERFPYKVGEGGYISFINDRSGVKNRFIKKLSSDDNGFPNSNLDRNLIRHHTVKGNDLSVYTLYRDGAYRAYLEVIDKVETNIYNTPLASVIDKQLITPLVINEPEKEEVKDGFLFQSDFDDPEVIEPIGISKKTPVYDQRIFSLRPASEAHKDVEPFNSSRAVASRLKYKMIELSSNIDNMVLFEGLESYLGDDQELLSQPLGIRFKARLKDLFEDYVVELGARFPTSLNGSEYYLLFEDNKRLIDRRYALYRKSNTVNQNINTFPVLSDKKVSYLAMAQFKYPFDIYRSLTATGIMRFDNLYPRVTEEDALESPFFKENRVGLRLEYIFDNTLDVELNVKNGTRYKFYVEALNKYELSVTDGFDFDGSTGFTTLVGGDFRHYIPVAKFSVIALRLAGGTSFGSNRMMYYLGGVESAMFGKFNNEIPIPAGDEFAYKALAPHLRGFDHNIRNGSSYLLFNGEIRVPVVRHLFKRVRNTFVRNIMLTSFFDIGTAWHGLSPYSNDSPLNTVFLEATNISIIANYYRDPIVMGYGMGFRTSLFGYYLKLDRAWGIETRQVQNAKWHFSLGMDF